MAIHTRRVLGIMLMGLAACAAADQKVLFEETHERFANPERGFYQSVIFTEIDDIRPLEDLRDEYVTLIYGRIPVNDFRDKDLSREFLNKIEWGFYRTRQTGLKVILCVSYSDKIGDPDASLDTILRHIDQLKLLLHENADVLLAAEAGFIGPDGQWRHWQNGKETTDNYKRILMRLLGAMPKDRMVVLAHPQYKRDIFLAKTLTDKQAFSDAPIARVGYYNNTFLSGPDDSGVYTDQMPRWAWIDHIGLETRFVPFGAQLTQRDVLNDCGNTIEEMERLHCSWLNRDCPTEIRQYWQKTGCLDPIERRLGYRFVLRSVAVTDRISIDDTPSFDIQICLDNVGFASPFNPRPVELVLRSGSRVYTQQLADDPRLWLPGKPIVIQANVKIPNEFLGSTGRLELHLPDAAESLRDNSRYAIRLANTNVWDETTGSNILVRQVEIPSPQVQIKSK
ncbi:MAG: DUF4832 domain-containing protein [Anaerohalosphaeraceae bacterium]